MKFDWVFFKSYSFRRQFRRQFSMQNYMENGWELTSELTSKWITFKNTQSNFTLLKVINEISVKFDWVFLKVIHLDVKSDVNSQLFFM